MDNISHANGSKGLEEQGLQDFSVPSEKVDLDVGQMNEGTMLHKGLHARQITMIAMGGAIGTGLIIGTGQGLATAGPASITISYAIVGFVVYLVMGALGEMATWIPMASGFTGYATRFCDPSLGFALGWSYWLKYIVVTPNQLTAAALVIQYWVPREQVNPGAFIAIFMVAIIIGNYLGIEFFGALEFVLSSVKVVVMIGIIILCLVLALGGGPDHDRKGFRYWKNPGAFKPYMAEGDLGKFLAVWASMVTATFAYLGTELVGITVGEAVNPRKTIPRAIRLTFWRIIFFYVLSVFLVGLNVPYNSPDLLFANKKKTSASASPFVVAISSAGIRILPSIFNGSLQSRDRAPRFLARTNARGVPFFALGASSIFTLLAFMNVSSGSETIFSYLASFVTMFGLLVWISILASHIFFVRARRAQGVLDSALAYTAPLGIQGSYFALAFCVIVALTKNFSAFIPNNQSYGNFDYKSFITGYLGIPIYLGLYFGHKVIRKTRVVHPKSCDLYSGKDRIDQEEAEYMVTNMSSSRPKTLFGRLIAILF
ncbi:AAT family amino acid transporter [Penicillium verrucosum]|uniref:AAT family amino acid transporter n=1 Tax=Penicillium verrucosum TaxID=60171 RepID=UPI0025456429|nr:AAT family amino acid transporter [Penicillium verrucosum]KAJ5941539.1 AAT family amino acid transporter [Penicillium verrucosum]